VRDNPRIRRYLTWAGGLLALAIGIALYSQFGLDNELSRDEAIYAYAGQQFAHGVPFYSSIFEQKTPLAAILAGVGAVIARALEANDLHTIRLVFFAFACLTVVGVYLLAKDLWNSRLTGLLAAAVFASFRGFAVDALGGPDAKTPGICFAVFSMALLVRRRWFWGAFAGSLAFLVWQPLGIYVALAVVLAAIAPGREQRWSRLKRVAAGAAIPIAAVVLYLALSGALDRFIVAAFLFPLFGLQREHESLGDRFSLIGQKLAESYGTSGVVLVFGGLLLVCALFAARVRRFRGLASSLHDPYCGVVFASFVPIVVFSLFDFQGYPDVFPALPYAAIGWGGAWAAATHGAHGERARHAVTALGCAAVAVIVGLSWHAFDTAPENTPGLVAQRTDASSLDRLLRPGETLYVFQDPRALVLTRRRNPDRFVYVGGGIAKWRVDHTAGGFPAWKARVAASHPTIVVMGRFWDDQYAIAMKSWLHQVYRRKYLRDWRVFVTPAVLQRARAQGITLTDVSEPELPSAGDR
jgi:4-amino-4-deoxy-L-arabinose transferase-like glycosyltransferase